MITFYKILLLRVYIYFFGLNFYFTELMLDGKHSDELAIKYLNDYEVKFLFSKSEIRYYFYILGFLFKKTKSIYAVSASYSDNVPDYIKECKNVRLYVRSGFFYLIQNDRLVYEHLTNVYLEFIRHEIEKKRL